MLNFLSHWMLVSAESSNQKGSLSTMLGIKNLMDIDLILSLLSKGITLLISTRWCGTMMHAFVFFLAALFLLFLVSLMDLRVIFHDDNVVTTRLQLDLLYYEIWTWRTLMALCSLIMVRYVSLVRNRVVEENHYFWRIVCCYSISGAGWDYDMGGLSMRGHRWNFVIVFKTLGGNSKHW